MSNRQLHELATVEPRESKYTLDDLRIKLSSIEQNGNFRNQFEIESILCLANEIQKIKDFLKEGSADKILD